MDKSNNEAPRGVTIHISNLLYGARSFINKFQAQQIKKLVELWVKHLSTKPGEAVTLNWENIDCTDYEVIASIFEDVQDRYPALALSHIIRHTNTGMAISDDLKRIFSYATLYNTDENYKAISNHVCKELANLGPKN